MRIHSSDITLSSEYRAATRQTRQESLTVTTRPTAPAPLSTPPAATNGAVNGAVGPDGEPLDPKLLLLKLMIEALTGEKIDTLQARDLAPNSQVTLTTTDATAAPAATQPSWGVSYQSTTTASESQQLTVTAQGVVLTADRREIPFTLTLNLADASTTTETVSFRAGNAVDPLVIHFAGPAAALTGGRVAFDLNADGRAESIPFTGPGSGFLALDANGDGRVTDGRELFGPRTGSGFQELAALDSDGNGWLDATDPAFAALRVWEQGADGAPTLTSLSAHGVGALYLSHIGAQFSITDADRTPLGEARRAGLYLTEDGRPGALQQIDLHV